MQKGSTMKSCHGQRSNWFDTRIYFEIYLFSITSSCLPLFAMKDVLFVELVAQLMSAENHLLDTLQIS